MNRTTEFFQALKGERNRKRPGAGDEVTFHRQENDFSKMTKLVKYQLAQATENLLTLRSLIHGMNVLDANNKEINDRVSALKMAFFSISRNVEDLEKMKSAPKHLANAAKSLRRDLQLITRDFNSCMEERAKKVQEAAERHRAMNIGFRSSGQSFATAYGRDDVGSAGAESEQIVIREERNRYESVRNVESAVHEVAKLFNSLSEIIAQDDYAIMRIDENTEEAIKFLQEGESQLRIYYDKIKGNKCLMIQIFGVLLIFALIFVLIV
jgi:syntaxin 5